MIAPTKSAFATELQSSLMWGLKKVLYCCGIHKSQIRAYADRITTPRFTQPDPKYITRYQVLLDGVEIGTVGVIDAEDAYTVEAIVNGETK